MARLLYVIHHSTDLPERAAAALHDAEHAREAGHEVALWLAGEGVRLGIRGVAETLREPGGGTAAGHLDALLAQGAGTHLVRRCFVLRSFEEGALRTGARLVEPEALGELVAEGWNLVPT